MSNSKQAKTQKSKLDQFNLYFEFDRTPREIHKDLKQRTVK